LVHLAAKEAIEVIESQFAEYMVLLKRLNSLGPTSQTHPPERSKPWRGPLVPVDFIDHDLSIFHRVD
jgi:hypothetical protein